MKNELKNSYRSGYNKGLGFGIVLIILGLLFLGFNFDVLPTRLKWIVFSWPMILVVLGLLNLFKRKPFSASILLIIGVFFLLPKLFRIYPEYFPNFDGDFAAIFWPILLILGGLLFIMRQLFGDKWGADEWSSKSNYASSQHKGTCRPGSFSKNSVFGTGEHIILEPEFKGGELNAVFGAVTLDLRKTLLPEGDTFLEINAVFGEVNVLIPDNWQVESNVDAVFGTFEDKRRLSDAVITGHKLIIVGACVFGSGKLKN